MVCFICKGHSDQLLSADVRFSKLVGVSYLVRSLARLSEFLKIPEFKDADVKYFAECAVELTEYLNRNINRFYDADTYYIEA
jgi:hypothetical protein